MHPRALTRLALLVAALAPAVPAAAQTAAQAQPVPIAVTQSGLRVECQDAAVGERSIRTPFGLLSVPTDPVAELTDGGPQLQRLLALHDAGDLDDLGLLQDLSTAGHLRALADHARAFAQRDPSRLEPYLALEAWGARLDPVPRELARDRRIAWLWERVNEGRWHETVLTAARLREEASEAFQAPSEQVVSIADLRRALRKPTAQHRRAAALVAGKQQEFSMREFLLLHSLTESDAAARDGASWAAGQVHPQVARHYWARNLARGDDAARSNAAFALARNAGPEGLKILMHVLAAHDRHTGERFEFAGREVWVVAESDSFVRGLKDYDLNRPENDLRLPATDRDYVDLGSTFKVTRYREDFTWVLLQALDQWAGERTGRTPAAWLAWYLENYAPPKED